MNILRYAFKNIFRNLFLSISSIIIIGLLAFFVNILLFVNSSADKFIQSINNRISFTINFRDGFDQSSPRAQMLMKTMAAAFPDIKVDYISQVQAFAILQSRNPDLAALVEHGDQNPLPNSLQISNIDLDSYSHLNDNISRFQDILQYDAGDMSRKLVDYRSQYERVTVVVRILTMLQIGVYILMGLFIFTVFVVVNMIIRNFIFFLQDEVRIIELV